MKVIRIGVCALVAFAVVAHGAVEEWSAAVLEAGAGALLVFWGWRVFRRKERELRGNPVLTPMAALALVTLGQIVARSTVFAYKTRQELLLFSACLVLVFLTAQAFRTVEDWRGFVWFLMALGFVVSVFGILQQLTFNGKLYWFRELRYGGIPFGPYVNRNHFAGLMELVIPPGLAALVLGKVRRDRWTLAGLFCLFPIGALFFSASRGGIVSFIVQLGWLGILVWTRRGQKRAVLAGGAVVLLAALLVAWLGVGKVLERFAPYQPLEVTQSKRVSMARDTWRIFMDHRWVGTGLGTLEDVYPKYESLYDGKIVNHAHNDYLEALAETGLAGGACYAWFLFLLLRRGLRSLRPAGNSLGETLQAGAGIACGGLLVHGFVDFNFHIPSNAMTFFILALLAMAKFESQKNRSLPV